MRIPGKSGVERAGRFWKAALLRRSLSAVRGVTRGLWRLKQEKSTGTSLFFNKTFRTGIFDK
jgi:hypothetical protein